MRIGVCVRAKQFSRGAIAVLVVLVSPFLAEPLRIVSNFEIRSL